jgi:2-polyprenyl-3-methyl-5-hydroxy-6-metoxy-1,4-benzoquinol methylase
MGMFTLSLSGLLAKAEVDVKSFDDADPTFISRYLIQAGILEAYQLHQGSKKLKVLDVGGAGSIISKFIDTDLTIIDVLPNEKKFKKYVQASALDMPFPDKSFDAVISCDVLEHIPKDDQVQFLQEAARVTKDLLVIAAPFNLKGVRDAEVAANNYFKKMSGQEHPWLIEHLRSELPALTKAKVVIENQGLHTTHVSHTSLDNWQLVTRAGFLMGQASVHPEFTDVIRKLNDYYLKHMMATDFSATGYRSFLVASRRHEVDIKIEPDVYNPDQAMIYAHLTDAILELL